MTAPIPIHVRAPDGVVRVYSRGLRLPVLAAAWVAVVVVGLVRAGEPEGGAVRELRPLLDAIRQVETGGQPSGGRDAVGDRGRSRGPYQIQRAYWLDSRVPGEYEQVRDPAYSEQTMLAYWTRYCPAALAEGDYETLARTHNGGLRGPRRTATVGYWRRVKAAMEAQR